MRTLLAAATLTAILGLLPAAAIAQEIEPDDRSPPGFVIDPPGWLGRQAQIAVLPGAGGAWLTGFNTRRLDANRLAASVLVGWGALHAAGAGTASFFVEDPQLRAFLQADAAVGAVALGSAIAGLVVAAGIDPAALDYGESLGRGLTLERLLLVGIGLDLAGATAGGLLWALGDEQGSARRAGYGQGLLLQGVALLLFDAALLLVNLEYEDRLLLVFERPLGDALGFGLQIRF